MAHVKVIENATGIPVDTFDTTGWPESKVDRLERGLLRNMDRDRFTVARTDDPE